MLDGRLVITGDEQVHELLTRDAVRGPLLQVLHVHSGQVNDRSVHAFAPSALDTSAVRNALIDACDLAHALRGAPG
ncbi:MAG: hypothetical protein KTR31_31885 [Myxococcales bacterium]|nr:hypothetical protein [Myxococcales bacterium]